ncbi:carbohydrate-binding module family 50 protein [Apiospora aurea]|uniref:Carbohydrate-binding module family 50 protein n=1 Tax=Apiospora aurea TaxID=335848 RepID=A0ABR1QQC4_9PEZI
MHFPTLVWLLVAERAIAAVPPFRQFHARGNTSVSNVNVRGNTVANGKASVVKRFQHAVAAVPEEAAAHEEAAPAEEAAPEGEAEAVPEEAEEAVPEEAADAALCAEGQSVTYTVQPADTVGKIAKSLGSGICDIATANALANLDVIFPNQTLSVPVALAAPDDTSCRRATPSSPSRRAWASRRRRRRRARF